MFEIANKIAICKIYTCYTSKSSTGKLKPTGVLSFMKTEPISEET
jgi:hypothetical protein